MEAKYRHLCPWSRRRRFEEHTKVCQSIKPSTFCALAIHETDSPIDSWPFPNLSFQTVGSHCSACSIINATILIGATPNSYCSIQFKLQSSIIEWGSRPSLIWPQTTLRPVRILCLCQYLKWTHADQSNGQSVSILTERIQTDSGPLIAPIMVAVV